MRQGLKPIGPKPDIPGNCVPMALEAVTGYPAETWLDEIRRFDPSACSTAVAGVSPTLYIRLMVSRGAYPIFYPQPVPLHKACADLHGCRALLCIKATAQFSHAIAAQGFMVVDNGSMKPAWYADWIADWKSRNWIEYEARRRPIRVLFSLVIPE